MSMIRGLVRKLRAYADQYNRPPYGREIEGTDKLLSEAADVIEELSAKLHASQMERSSQYYHDGWIPCDENMPEEHDSMFAKWYGTEKWKSAMWKTQSDNVIVTIEFEDGTRKTDMMRTHDGEWFKDIRILKFKVIAWQPLPKPYISTED